MRRRTIIILTFGAILLLLSSLFLKQSVNFVVGNLVVKVFEKETGCDVTISNPRVVLHSLMASAERIWLHCEEEPESHGVFIERVTTRADLSLLTSKRIVLHDLKLYGTRAISHGLQQTGFVNLIDFIARDPIPNKPRHWHSFLTGGWKARVSGVEIFPPADGHNNLEIGIDSHLLRWTGLKMTFDKVGEAHQNYFASTADADQFAYQSGETEIPDLGRFIASGTFGDDKLSSLSAKLIRNVEAKPHISAEGTIYFRDAGRYEIEVSGALPVGELLHRLNLGSSTAQQLAGEILARGKVEGELKSPLLKSTLTLAPQSAISIGAIEIPLTQLLADISLSETQQNLKLNVDISERRAAELVFSFDSQEKRISSDGYFDLRDLKFLNLPVSSIAGKIKTIDEKVSVSDIRINTNAGVITGSAELDAYRNVQAKLSSAELRLAALPQLNTLSGMDPLASGELVVSGPLVGLNYSGKFELTPQDERTRRVLSKAFVSVEGQGDTITLNGEGDSGRLKFQLSRVAGDTANQIELSAAARNIMLGDYLRGAYDKVAFGPGALNAELSFRGLESDLLGGKGYLALSSFTLPIDQHTLVLPSSVKFTLGDGAIVFGALPILLDGKELVISGDISRSTGWAVDAQGSWELGSLITESSVLEQVSGDLALNLKVRGSVADPELGGSLRLTKGSISLPFGSSIIGASELEVVGNFSRTGIDFTSISAAVEGGEISGMGEVRALLDPLQRHSTLRFKLDSIAIEPVRNFTTVLNGEVAFDSRGEETLISGAIKLFGGTYEDNINIERILRELTRRITGANFDPNRRASGVGASNPVKLDLKLSTEEPVVIDTNIVKAEVRGDLRVGGDTVSPLIEGRVETTEGSFFVGSSEFSLVSGTFDFNEQGRSVDPILNIVGESEVNDGIDSYRVRMLIDGTLTKPEVNFDSEGGLSQREIVAKLGAGASVNRITLLRNEKRDEYRFEALLRPTSKASLEERISGLTGFSTVEVGSAYSSVTGEYVPKIFAERPLPYGLSAVIESELGGARASSAGVVLPVTPYSGVSFGWTNGQSATNPDTSSGALDLGIHYRETFRGTGLIPPFWKSSGGK